MRKLKSLFSNPFVQAGLTFATSSFIFYQIYPSIDNVVVVTNSNKDGNQQDIKNILPNKNNNL